MYVPCLCGAYARNKVLLPEGQVVFLPDAPDFAYILQKDCFKISEIFLKGLCIYIKKLENCFYKTQVMTLCPAPIPIPCPVPTRTLQHIESIMTCVCNVKASNAIVLSKTIFFFLSFKKLHAHPQYACNICAKFLVNPIAFRKAKIVYNFGLFECNRLDVNGKTCTGDEKSLYLISVELLLR